MSDVRPLHGLGQRLLAAAQQDTSWLVRNRDDPERTLTTREIVCAYNERLIDPDSYVWTDGMATWQELQAVEQLVAALHADRAPDGAPARRGEASPRSHGAARQEDSTMFSLAMLVGDGLPKGTDAPREDSGLIDLARMTASPAEAAAVAPPDPLLVPGLFSPPAAEPSREVPRERAPARRRDRWIVGALVSAVALLAAMLVFQIVRTGGRTPAPPSASVSAPERRASAPATPAEQPAAASAPAPVIAAPPPEPEASVAPSAAPVAAPKLASSSRPPVTKTAPVPAVSAKTTTTAAGNCPCPPDDLMCNMRCHSKH